MPRPQRPADLESQISQILNDGDSYHSSSSRLPLSLLHNLRVHFGLSGAHSPEAEEEASATNSTNPSSVTESSSSENTLTAPTTNCTTAPITPPKRRQEAKLGEKQDGGPLLDFANRCKLAERDVGQVDTREDGIVKETRGRSILSGESKGDVDFEQFRASYDPQAGLSDSWLRDLFLDDVYWSLERLQMEYVIMGSDNEKYWPLQDDPRRRDLIHQQLCRLIKTMENYKTYRTSSISNNGLRILPGHFFPTPSHIQKLAMIEAARKARISSETLYIKQLVDDVSDAYITPFIRDHLHGVLTLAPQDGPMAPPATPPPQFLKHGPKFLTYYLASPKMLFARTVFHRSKTKQLERLCIAVFSLIMLFLPTAVLILYPGTLAMMVVIPLSVTIVAIAMAIGLPDNNGVGVFVITSAYFACLAFFLADLNSRENGME
ncbi:hypothetical protein BP6252_12786 [Coleophoma cylindrospora]|uniref:DUF6594 domain-containing protein n=1 Tax=Coleophoma cylindrospora TaxID=1849047 RepID=A0A3D8QD23_9HELO|nr:hypothetical protein BP6252_12786 [Coleophoma cylindrospora]